VDGFCTEKKEILIHNSLNISDLAGAVKKWLDEILPKSTGHVGFSMTHRGSILKETSSLVDCGIDKDSKVFVTLEFKPPVSIEPSLGAPKSNPVRNLQYPFPPKEGYSTNPSFESLKKMTREEL
jgi:hypothetical protein